LGLIDDIGDGPVGLDTVIFVYFIEEHPRFLPLLTDQSRVRPGDDRFQKKPPPGNFRTIIRSRTGLFDLRSFIHLPQPSLLRQCCARPVPRKHLPEMVPAFSD